jgi:hypothetical protein
MFKKIRASKFSKIVVYYLVLMIFLELSQPMRMYALTDGPSQPEFNSFTPISTSEMVDLATGDFSYNIPIMDVGGYPINLAYNSGVSMDQEASWVGLGWNLNVGQINRSVRGLPDDFKGDEVINENNMKKNLTLSIKPYFNWQLVGFEKAPQGQTGDPINIGTMGAGVDLRYNNYRGISAVPSFGMSFNLSDNISVGADITSSNEEGVTVTPNVSLHKRKEETNEIGTQFFGSASPSITYNSRQGLQSFNLSASGGYQKISGDNHKNELKFKEGNSSTSGSISFLNTTFTPSVRTPMKNTQFTFSFSTGAEIYGLSGELSIAAGTTIQSLKEKKIIQKAYGYEFTDFGDAKSLLDFNREKEQSTVTKNTNLLPLTNYTYDVLTIQSQIGGGTFRPYRGQVGMVYDAQVQDVSTSGSVSLELEGAQGVHVGGNIKLTKSTTKTGRWNTVATPYLKESNSNTMIDYEKLYYKKIGEGRVDKEKTSLFDIALGGESAITLNLNGATNDAMNRYSKKQVFGSGSILTSLPNPFLQPIRRLHREKRNSAIQKISVQEVQKYNMGSVISANSFAKSHHTAGYIITESDGSRQIFGETAYNREKIETAFSVGAIQGDCQNGLVSYQTGDDSPNNAKGMENYFNRITTPEYAHTYLLTSVLSTDYEDVTQNGPTPDDLGTYTRFIYTKPSDKEYNSSYKWRVPFEKGKASFNEGFKTDKRDQKGSYLYGIKEVKYLKRIETKTHVAFIDLEARKDGFGVENIEGGLGSSSVSYKIKTIRLYSRPEALKARLLDDDLDNDDLSVKPIKTAHFIYDYSLCKPAVVDPNYFNNSGATGSDLTENEISNNGGKLTLRKVYFTYRDSNIGKFMPYTFDYDNIYTDHTGNAGVSNNYNYNVKNYNVWGYYLPNNSCVNSDDLTSPQEFPYVNQDEAFKTDEDNYASAWSLKTINLPSGGKIDVTYESDDYQFVQDKKAMRMFKVHGVCGSDFDAYDPSSSNNKLYGGNGSDYVVIDIGQAQSSDPSPEVIAKKYTEGLSKQPIYFNFFLNMIGNNYDYVTGYFEMNGSAKVKEIDDNLYLFVPMKKINREGRGGGGSDENPISVAGWFFGREYLPYHIYGQNAPTSNVGSNLISLGRSLLSNLESMTEILTGANGRLKNTFGCAKFFKPNKSWIRLYEPDGIKIGGGSRVKKLMIYDQWDEMVGSNNVTSDINRYKKEYGQEFIYRLNDDNPLTSEIDESTSSGVASYEPNMCKENPLVQPFYNQAEKLSIPSYQEKPFGESFFPAALVTYSRVKVKNVTAADDELGGSKTKSGTVITEHYTTKDFPTITDYTDLSKSKDFDTNERDMILKMASQLFKKNVNVHNYLKMTQGFYIETNDMNGKLKKQSVYNNGNQLISSIEYQYSTNDVDSSVLDNTLPVVDVNGLLSKEEIATHYDVINDFRMSYSNSLTRDLNPNVDVIPIGIIPIILGFGVLGKARHTNILKTAVTTKVVHKTGVLKKKIAFDLGSVVTTENLAWDATTGQVLVTKTNNEFDDSYYTINYPAYWFYDGMGLATNNLGIDGVLTHPTNANPGYFAFNGDPVQTVFHIGDELDLSSIQLNSQHEKVWVAGFNTNYNSLLLIRSDGSYLTPCMGEINYRFKVTRSGYRNQQMQSMASITTMNNPIDWDGDNQLDNSLYNFGTKEQEKVINASAIEYSDFWKPQAESRQPLYTQNELNSIANNGGSGVNYPVKLDFNPFLNNYKAEWRPLKSYAYLVGRINNNGSPRNQGFFKKFNSFYTNIDHKKWTIDSNNWTFASEVSQFSTFGPEIENKDALERFSSAQYGYNSNLPMAVATNSKYQSMGFNGFEESDVFEFDSSINLGDYPHFGFFRETGANLDDVVISNKKSHTGNKSIRVSKGKKAVIFNPLFSTDIQRESVDCGNEQGGGPACPLIGVRNQNQSVNCIAPSETYTALDISAFSIEPVSINNFIIREACTNNTVSITEAGVNWINSNGPFSHDAAVLCFAANFYHAGDYILEFDINYQGSQTQHVYVRWNVTINTDPEDLQPVYNYEFINYSCNQSPCWN